MSKNWDALVLNDYEAVMPLTWNRKYGIKYLYQPFLAAQLGVFGKHVTEDIVGQCCYASQEYFKFIEISLNSGNIFSAPSGFSILRSNYELDLSKSYEILQAGYSENTRRNIRKAEEAGHYLQKGFDVGQVIELAIQQMRSYTKSSKENIRNFRRLYAMLLEKQMATTYGIFSADQKLIASCVYFFSHKRAYYILVGNDPSGRATGASHALIDFFIRDHSGQEMILDFEGSDIAGLAKFYAGFGATHLVYPALRINNLPFFLKWLKK
jgi:hypothetical protein